MLIHKNEFELILAIGGGSVSKYFSVYNEKKESYKRKKIPTTAGTGSEITPWDMDEKKKYSLHLPELFSQIALYVTLSVPKDTLSHALE